MNEIYDKINSIEINDKYLLLKCKKNNLKINIINGCVDIEIFNSENKYIGFFNLETNDIIKIKYDKFENNYLIPKIIYVNTKYNFISDASDDEYF